MIDTRMVSSAGSVACKIALTMTSSALCMHAMCSSSAYISTRMTNFNSEIARISQMTIILLRLHSCIALYLRLYNPFVCIQLYIP